MQINEARSDGEAARIDLALCLYSAEFTNGSNAVAIYRNIRTNRCGAGSVENTSIANNYLVSHFDLPR
jgi:hypothetical protein